MTGVEPDDRNSDVSDMTPTYRILFAILKCVIVLDLFYEQIGVFSFFNLSTWVRVDPYVSNLSTVF